MTSPSDTRGPSLLDDPLFLVEVADRSIQRQSLPEVVARLLIEDDPIVTFPGLAAEQFSHWYRFLVRCASRALRGLPDRDPAGSWDEQGLAGLLRDRWIEASGGEAAWLLHNPDLRVPAFLQPPVADATADASPADAGYKEGLVASITALLGSKNFERKADAVRAMSAPELIYALLEFQGGVIYGGSGSYQTQLTPSKSGKGSGVPFMGIRLPEGLGATFQRDVAAFRAAESRIREDLKVNGEVWALWTLPWDGDKSMPSTELDPDFIPLARLVRVDDPGNDSVYSTVWFRTSSVSRVEDLSGGALLGDPFTPTIPNPKEDGGRKVRGVMDYGFNYREVAELLGFGERGVRPSDSVTTFFEERGSDRRAGVQVVLEGLAFEQGKTLGFHRKVLPLPIGRASRASFTRPEPFREAHARMLAVLRDGKSILVGSARIVLTGAPSKRGKAEHELVGLPLARLEVFAEEGDAYLDHLFRFGQREHAGDESWEEEWRKWVSERAGRAFMQALPMLPSPVGQRVRREADALNYLEARLWKLRAGEAAGVRTRRHGSEEATA